MEIEFKNVCVIMNEGTPLGKIILKDASFKIEENSITAFVGDSNSGKTAIAELLDALIFPTNGSIKIGNFINNGRRIKNINKLRFDVGYMFKNPYDMFFNRTVSDEIEFGMKYFKYKLEKIDLRATDALKMVGLDETYLKLNPLDLSLAEAKKVALASIIVFNPKVIVLDEPTIGLNNKEKKSLIRLLKMLKKKYNKTIIIMSKDTDFLYQFVEKVFLMHRARIVTSGDKEILTDSDLITAMGLSIPKISEFISIANKENGADLEFYTDIRDLIKGVYRDVL